jgi:hypothetical protein
MAERKRPRPARTPWAFGCLLTDTEHAALIEICRLWNTTQRDAIGRLLLRGLQTARQQERRRREGRR